MDPRREDAPVPGKQYMLTGGHDDKCILNGNTWAESEVKPPAEKGSSS